MFLQEHIDDFAIFLSGSLAFTTRKVVYRYVAERLGFARNCRNVGSGKWVRSEADRGASMGARKFHLRAHQIDKRSFRANFPLHKTTLLCYKQFTESICVAGWAHFCNSRARPASNEVRGIGS